MLLVTISIITSLSKGYKTQGDAGITSVYYSVSPTHSTLWKNLIRCHRYLLWPLAILVVSLPSSQMVALELILLSIYCQCVNLSLQNKLSIMSHWRPHCNVDVSIRISCNSHLNFMTYKATLEQHSKCVMQYTK